MGSGKYFQRWEILSKAGNTFKGGNLGTWLLPFQGTTFHNNCDFLEKWFRQFPADTTTFSNFLAVGGKKG